MIAKITRGSRPGDIGAYLHGPGKANEHRYDGQPGGKVIGGNLGREGDWDERRWAADLRLAAAEREDIRKPIWQMSLRNAPGDRRLSDQEWADAGQQVAERMGYAEHPWVMVRHGEDHVHIVASRVSERGEVWHARQDYRAAQSAATEVEKQYGLEQAPRRSVRRGERMAAVEERQKHRDDEAALAARTAAEQTAEVRQAVPGQPQQAEMQQRTAEQEEAHQPGAEQRAAERSGAESEISERDGAQQDVRETAAERVRRANEAGRDEVGREEFTPTRTVSEQFPPGATEEEKDLHRQGVAALTKTNDQQRLRRSQEEQEVRRQADRDPAGEASAETSAEGRREETRSADDRAGRTSSKIERPETETERRQLDAESHESDSEGRPAESKGASEAEKDRPLSAAERVRAARERAAEENERDSGVER